MLAIIIPAKNEGLYIRNTLIQARKTKEFLPTEIIVVDNGSTDNTLELASQYADRTISLQDGSISEVRNRGALIAKGKVLAFIDGDVEITASWRNEILQIVGILDTKPNTICGARCHAATNTKYLDKYWFNRLLEYQSDYVNSGNLITSAKLFNTLGGFDSTLSTAEDYDFCRRAREQGAAVIQRENLIALHHGYPSTIKAFVARERWHGRQDFTSISLFINSKVAMIAALNALMFCICMSLSLAFTSVFWVVIYVMFLSALAISLTLIRYNFSNLTQLLLTATIFALYIWSRTMSLVDQLTSIVKKFMHIFLPA